MPSRSHKIVLFPLVMSIAILRLFLLLPHAVRCFYQVLYRRVQETCSLILSCSWRIVLAIWNDKHLWQVTLYITPRWQHLALKIMQLVSWHMFWVFFSSFMPCASKEWVSWGWNVDGGGRSPKFVDPNSARYTQTKVSCERGSVLEFLTFVCTDLVRGQYWPFFFISIFFNFLFFLT